MPTFTLDQTQRQLKTTYHLEAYQYLINQKGFSEELAYQEVKDLNTFQVQLLEKFYENGLTAVDLKDFEVSNSDGFDFQTERQILYDNSNGRAFAFLLDKGLSPKQVVQELNGLNYHQVSALKALYDKGLRGEHLRSWQPAEPHEKHAGLDHDYFHNEFYAFSQPHRFALQKAFEDPAIMGDPEKAIKEINWLSGWLLTGGASLYYSKEDQYSKVKTRDQILEQQYIDWNDSSSKYYENNLLSPYAGLTAAQKETLQALYSRGLSTVHLKSWKPPVQGEQWSDLHHAALVAIVTAMMPAGMEWLNVYQMQNKRRLLDRIKRNAEEKFKELHDTQTYMLDQSMAEINGLTAEQCQILGRFYKDGLKGDDLRAVPSEFSPMLNELVEQHKFSPRDAIDIFKRNFIENEFHPRQFETLKELHQYGLRDKDVKAVAIDSLAFLSVLIKQYSFQIKDAINTVNRLTEISAEQFETLKNLYHYNLRIDHLIKWQPVAWETWEEAHNDALVYLIKTKKLSPEKAIVEIADLNPDQIPTLVQNYKYGLRADDFRAVPIDSLSLLTELIQQHQFEPKEAVDTLNRVAELKPGQFEILKELYQDGLRFRHLKNWQPVPGEKWGEEQNQALRVLVMAYGVLPSDAIKEISHLHSEKLEALVKRYNKGLKSEDLGDIPNDSLSLLTKLMIEDGFAPKDAVYTIKNKLLPDQFRKIKQDLDLFDLKTEDLEKWQPAVGEHWGKPQRDALRYLIDEKKLAPTEALIEISQLTSNQIQTLLMFYEEDLRGFHLRGWQPAVGEKWQNNNVTSAVLTELMVKQSKLPEAAIQEISQLNSYQMQSLTKFYQNGLRGADLRAWQPATGQEWGEPQHNAIAYLIEQQNVAPAQAIAEINKLNNDQIQTLLNFYENGLHGTALRSWQPAAGQKWQNNNATFLVLMELIVQRHLAPTDAMIEINQLNSHQIQLLTKYYKNGLRGDDLRAWKSASGEAFGEHHANAMMFLMKPKQSMGFFAKPGDPTEALKKINEISGAQAKEIYQPKEPDILQNDDLALEIEERQARIASYKN